MPHISPATTVFATNFGLSINCMFDSDTLLSQSEMASIVLELVALTFVATSVTLFSVIRVILFKCSIWNLEGRQRKEKSLLPEYSLPSSSLALSISLSYSSEIALENVDSLPPSLSVCF